MSNREMKSWPHVFAKVGEGSKEVEDREEFVVRKNILYRRWRKVDGGELLQVVVPSKFREALVLLAHDKYDR